MTFKIVYNPSKGETVISENSLPFLTANYEKPVFKKEWKFYKDNALIGDFILNSTLFGWKASIKARIILNKSETSLDINFRQKGFFTYLISASGLDGEYMIYPHMEDKFSIFLNEKQIGALVRIKKMDFFHSTSPGL
ncbi:MAG: hypothetical protein ACRYFX_27095 [Janthinobacterium lividum]